MLITTKSTLLFGLLSYSFFSFSKQSTFSCEGIGKLSTEKVTWEQAYTRCLSEGGQLVSPADLPCKLPTSSSLSDIWLPDVFVQTPAIYSKGCYRLSTEKRTSVIFTANDIATCYEKCYQIAGNITFFALQGEKCDCLDDSIDTSKLETGICNKICQGNKNQLCGGESIYSVFQIVHQNFITDDEKVCGYFTSGQQKIKFDLCDNETEVKKPYCKPWVKNGSYKEEVIFYTWVGADYTCQSRNSTLADLDVNTIETLPSANNIDSSDYWIGLRKWIYLVRTLNDERKPIKCTIMTEGNKKKVSCEDKYKYYCVTGTQLDKPKNKSITNDNQKGSKTQQDNTNKDTTYGGSNNGDKIQKTLTSPAGQIDSESSDVTSRSLGNDVIRATSGTYTKENKTACKMLNHVTQISSNHSLSIT